MRVSSAASICAAIRVPAVVGYVLFEVRRSVFVMSPATIRATTPKITMETTTSMRLKPESSGPRWRRTRLTAPLSHTEVTRWPVSSADRAYRLSVRSGDVPASPGRR